MESPDIGDELLTMLFTQKVNPVNLPGLPGLPSKVSTADFLASAQIAPIAEKFGVPQIKSSLPRRGMLACLLGPAGTGKSSFALEWPSPEAIIDSQDEGILDLMSEGLVSSNIPVSRCSDYMSYKNALTRAVNGPSQTLVCESVTGLLSMCLTHSSITDYEGDRSAKKFLNYQAGVITAVDFYFNQIIDLMMLAQNRAKHVWFVGHTQKIKEGHVEGEDFLSVEIAALKRAIPIIEGRFQNIFVLADILSVTGKQGNYKVGTDFTRFMFPHSNPRYPSKNRMGLRCEFPFPSSPKEAYLKFCEVTNRNPKTGFRR